MGDKTRRFRWFGPRFSQVQVRRNNVPYLQVVHDPRPKSQVKVVVKSFGQSTSEARAEAQVFLHDAWSLGRLMHRAKTSDECSKLEMRFQGRLSRTAIRIITQAFPK